MSILSLVLKNNYKCLQTLQTKYRLLWQQNNISIIKRLVWHSFERKTIVFIIDTQFDCLKHWISIFIHSFAIIYNLFIAFHIMGIKCVEKPTKWITSFWRNNKMFELFCHVIQCMRNKYYWFMNWKYQDLTSFSMFPYLINK